LGTHPVGDPANEDVEDVETEAAEEAKATLIEEEVEDEKAHMLP